MINRVLLYNSGGGIGDAIQTLPLINALKNEFKNANFLYLCAHENHFNSSLKDLNFNIDTLRLNIKYFSMFLLFGKNKPYLYYIRVLFKC